MKLWVVGLMAISLIGMGLVKLEISSKNISVLWLICLTTGCITLGSIIGKLEDFMACIIGYVENKKKYLLIAILLCFVSCASRIEYFDVNAKVLSLNTKILQGQTIGGLLSSASGKISNDVIKVGISFIVKKKLYLVDLKLTHAELAYYKDKKELPLRIKYHDWDDGFIKIFLNNRYKGEVY